MGIATLCVCAHVWLGRVKVTWSCCSAIARRSRQFIRGLLTSRSMPSEHPQRHAWALQEAIGICTRHGSPDQSISGSRHKLQHEESVRLAVSSTRPIDRPTQRGPPSIIHHPPSSCRSAPEITHGALFQHSLADWLARLGTDSRPMRFAMLLHTLVLAARLRLGAGLAVATVARLVRHPGPYCCCKSRDNSHRAAALEASLHHQIGRLDA